MEQQGSFLADHTDLFPGLSPVLGAITQAYPSEAEPVSQRLKQLSQPWLIAENAGVQVSNSLLTPGGYPLEFNFSSTNKGLCYTADPGLPRDHPALKWQYIQDLASGFDSQGNDLLHYLATQEGQRFGSWISFRHWNEGTACKIYQEVTNASGSRVLEAMCRRFPGIKKEALQPLLLGVFPENPQTVEYYCGLKTFSKSVLQELFNLAEVGRLLPFALCCLSYMASEQQSTLTKRLRLGLSLRWNATGLPSLTIFVHAAQLFADNLRARTALLSMASQVNGEMPLYEKLTEQTEKPSNYFAHSLVGLKFEPSGKVEIGVGWRPKAD